MERVVLARVKVTQGMQAKLTHVNDLTQLQNEALEKRQQHVADACARLRGCVLIGATLHADDINVVQAFIGARTVQDRYGR